MPVRALSDRRPSLGCGSALRSSPAAGARRSCSTTTPARRRADRRRRRAEHRPERPPLLPGRRAFQAVQSRRERRAPVPLVRQHRPRVRPRPLSARRATLRRRWEVRRLPHPRPALLLRPLETPRPRAHRLAAAAAAATTPATRSGASCAGIPAIRSIAPAPAAAVCASGRRRPLSRIPRAPSVPSLVRASPSRSPRSSLAADFPIQSDVTLFFGVLLAPGLPSSPPLSMPFACREDR